MAKGTRASAPKGQSRDDGAAPRRAGLRALAVTLPKLTKRLVGKRGFAEGGLAADWPGIVGNEIASRCMPGKLSFERHAERRDGTLTLRVEAPFATELQRRAPHAKRRRRPRAARTRRRSSAGSTRSRTRTCAPHSVGSAGHYAGADRNKGGKATPLLTQGRKFATSSLLNNRPVTSARDRDGPSESSSGRLRICGLPSSMHKIW